MATDNIAGVKKGGIIKTIFLLPGKIFQWISYMFIGNTKGYGNVRQQTRLARSPIMTYVYSIIFWLIIAWLVDLAFFEGAVAMWVNTF